ncbi:MAG: GcrA family cell cycle regulator [Alphaproteobacteria bacterium]
MSANNFTNHDKAVAAQIERAGGYVGDTLQAGNSRSLPPYRFQRLEELEILEPSGDALFDDIPSQTYRLQTAKATTGGWTEDRIATLKRLWAKGYSASQIAVRLGGVTRNAVIGKANRLRLASRKGEYPRRNSRVRQRQTRPVPPWKISRAVSKPVTPADLASASPVPPTPLKLALLDLTENTCRWPIGDPQDENFHFCGCQTSGDGPYCEHHARMAFQPYVPRAKR